MRFEWDEDKRQSNIEKHGLDLIRAARLFDGRPRLDAASPRGREHRILSIGEFGRGGYCRGLDTSRRGYLQDYFGEEGER
jgi:uncharacterized DUF497 family protein